MQQRGREAQRDSYDVRQDEERNRTAERGSAMKSLGEVEVFDGRHACTIGSLDPITWAETSAQRTSKYGMCLLVL